MCQICSTTPLCPTKDNSGRHHALELTRGTFLHELIGEIHERLTGHTRQTEDRCVKYIYIYIYIYIYMSAGSLV